MSKWYAEGKGLDLEAEPPRTEFVEQLRPPPPPPPVPFRHIVKKSYLKLNHLVLNNIISSLTYAYT